MDGSLDMIKRLYIECTHTSESDLNTGIQRVVRKVIAQLRHSLPDKTPITLIKIHDGAFYPIEALSIEVSQNKSEAEVAPKPEDNTALLGQEAPSSVTFKSRLFEFLRRQRQAFAYRVKWKPLNRFLTSSRTEFGLTRILYMLSLIGVYKKLKVIIKRIRQPRDQPTNSSVVFAKGDVILMLDSSWHLPAWEAIEQAKKRGASVITVIYDLIPITHPQFCDQVLCQVFNAWFEQGKTKVDGYIAISKTVMQSVQDYLESKNVVIDDERFGYFYLGADIAKQQERARKKLKTVISKEDSYLIVSTIEPRKNHQYLLHTFNLLWEKGEQVKLHIVGRVGWKVEQLLIDIKRHPQFNKQLFIWHDLDDAELVYCYKNSKALLFPSYVEGFGLPIIEAQHYKLPVLVSDTPIHREIGADSVIYFDIEDAGDLANKISEVETGKRLLKDSVNFDLKKFTWKNSTDRLTQEIQRINAAL